MPVFNEDVSRVFEGLRVVFKSVQDAGGADSFDFFVLSDSNQPNQWIREEVAWVELCKQVGGFGKIFYRKRRQAINKKAGNVADFLRRWGRNYRYMVVLDADSVMTGAALARLVSMMEASPAVGIIQTAPRVVRGETLYSRLQSFANRLYSPLYLAGLNYWQQHEGNYWGHNAIIRVQPFMEHCALPELPGNEPFGGRILSHDFVEAALMRKAGWAVWLAHDIEGSYEEGPPTLIEGAKRDRRWCQGNLQHAWLLTARGFRPANRFHLLMGIMAYVSSPALAPLPDPGNGRDGRPDRAGRQWRIAAVHRHDVPVRLHGRPSGGADPLCAHDAPPFPAEVRERRGHARAPWRGGAVRGPRQAGGERGPRGRGLHAPRADQHDFQHEVRHLHAPRPGGGVGRPEAGGGR